MQELGAFILAGAKGPVAVKQMVEMIRAARGYRWVGIYKLFRHDLKIVAGTGDEPGVLSAVSGYARSLRRGGGIARDHRRG